MRKAAIALLILAMTAPHTFAVTVTATVPPHSIIRPFNPKTDSTRRPNIWEIITALFR